MKTLTVLIALFISITCHAGTVEDHQELLDAIQLVETGGCADPATATGDNGKALGWFQIHRIYWQDAIERNPELKKHGYEKCCTDRDLAEQVVVSYWNRYATEKRGADSDEARVRIHNGGPTGHRKQATEKYWRKVKEHLDVNNFKKGDSIQVVRGDHLFQFGTIARVVGHKYEVLLKSGKTIYVFKSHEALSKHPRDPYVSKTQNDDDVRRAELGRRLMRSQNSTFQPLHTEDDETELNAKEIKQVEKRKQRFKQLRSRNIDS